MHIHKESKEEWKVRKKDKHCQCTCSG